MADKRAKLDALLQSNILKRGNEIKAPKPRREQEAASEDTTTATPIAPTETEGPAPAQESAQSKPAEEPPLTRSAIRASLARHQAAIPRHSTDGNVPEVRE